MHVTDLFMNTPRKQNLTHSREMFSSRNFGFGRSTGEYTFPAAMAKVIPKLQEVAHLSDGGVLGNDWGN